MGTKFRYLIVAIVGLGLLLMSRSVSGDPIQFTSRDLFLRVRRPQHH